MLTNEQVSTMLTFINPDDFHDWLKVGLALHSEPSIDGLGLWDRWSSGGQKYCQGECAKRWLTFHAGGATSFGTLLYMAKQAGYKPDGVFHSNPQSSPMQTRPPEKKREITLKSDFAEFVKEYENYSYESICGELWEMSDYRPDYPTENDPVEESSVFLRALYEPEDFLFIGIKEEARKKSHVKTRDEWIAFFKKATCVPYEHITFNPIRPEGVADDKGVSYRNGANVARYIYGLAEHDHSSLHDQAAFWLKMLQKGFPVKALIFSGTKSIHCVFHAKADERLTLKAILTKIGFDGATFDIARLGRMPGHLREKSGKYQSILFLKGVQI